MTKGEETKQFIIERSAPIFNTKGIAATAMSDITEATQLSKGSLYVHFENKEVLAASAVDYNMQLLSNKVMAAVNKQKTAKDKLFAFVDTLKDPLSPPVTGGCPMMNFGTEADDTNQLVKTKVNQAFDNAELTIAGIIQQGIKEGSMNPDWNYKEFATMIFAMIEGGIVMSRVAGNISKMNIIVKNIKKMITEQLI
ncbi:TetR/AcrR family transcriptional regulator [Mucilaginibacter aquaedulcis]|uniref:TetR/AcrR family transcriptional regulator n=1 Tax=Mucilaginibacter aquaedulcis TaxID=1187081 RepID=UPI0025B53F53|nr:TetR/AcrR family transcriptional regulator [Mucilaginibacter aquaedulcis]MDN3547448.1 TetR/AcrR family transcriptional regulator [Mucilaginibacter aquaedulcis]